MPIITSDQFSNANDLPAVDLGAGEDLIVTREATLYALGTNSEAVRGSSASRISIFGEAFALFDDAIFMTSCDLEIGLGGTVNSVSGAGFRFTSGAEVKNNGQISGSIAGIQGDGVAGLTLRNTGTITGDAAGVRGGGSGDIDNSGTIIGDSAINMSGDTAVTVVNSGDILGDGTALNLYSSGSLARRTVTNTGTLLGDVLLSEGADSFNSSLGAMVGTVYAYGGDDTVLATSGRDTVFAGDGDDSVVGGAGDDVLEGGRGGDELVGGDGFDIVSFDLSVLASLANAANNTAEAAGDSYSGVEGLRGSFQNDTLIGDAQANLLDGGNGIDSLEGGNGDDRYFVTAGDIIVDTAGNDIAYASTSYNLAAGVAVETLRVRGTAGLSLAGNELANRIVGGIGADALGGGAGADQLYGQAGNDVINGFEDADRLSGGAGQDQFVFNTALGTIDRILDFVTADDTIVLENAIFAGLPAGALPAGAFRVIGVDPATPQNRILYNPANGIIYWDPDGNGAAPSVGFAVVEIGTVLTTADFLVI